MTTTTTTAPTTATANDDGDLPQLEAKPGHVRVLSIYEIFPSPENEKVYGPVNADDPDVVLLTDSIRELQGVQEPLLVTKDRYIVSGHRRYAAARLAGLKEVPCIVLGISSLENHDAFMKLLVECNEQRVKSSDQQMREAVVLVNKDHAYQALLRHRDAQASKFLPGSILLGEARKRHAISEAKRPMLSAVLEILEDIRKYWPVSDRTIHYQLLNDPPLRHARKRGSRYKNDPPSYKDLTDLLTRARLTSEIPMEAIHDPTRPVTTWFVFNNMGPYVREQLSSFLRDYRRNVQQSQPWHVEIVGEKNTVDAILKRAAGAYGIPVTTGRGYCSLAPRAAMAERFRASGKDKLVILLASDFDPEGEDISISFPRSMRDDFGIGNVEAAKVALTAEQVSEYNLPPVNKAKKRSSRYRGFVDLHGDDVFELEALPPGDLERLVKDAIERVMDRDKLNQELDREREEAAQLEASRRVAFKALGWEATE
jgi:hypothetical protein